MTLIKIKNDPELDPKFLTAEAEAEALEEFRMRYKGSEPERADARNEISDKLGRVKPNSLALKRLRRVLVKFQRNAPEAE